MRARSKEAAQVEGERRRGLVIADGLEKTLETLYPHADVMVHQDPV